MTKIPKRVRIPNLKDSIIIRRQAIRELSGENDFGDCLDGITRWGGVPEKQPTEEQIQNKIQEWQDAEPLRQLREERNIKLAESDWMSLSDSPKISEKWKTYRKELRDLTSTEDPKLDEYGQLTNVTWPTEPE